MVFHFSLSNLSKVSCSQLPHSHHYSQSLLHYFIKTAGLKILRLVFEDFPYCISYLVSLFFMKNEGCLKLMKSLNHKNHCGERSWMGNMKDPLAVLVEDVWYRGSCLEKSSNDEFKIMLMDFGLSVIASRMMIKPLHPRFSKVPFFCHRVRLS